MTTPLVPPAWLSPAAKVCPRCKVKAVITVVRGGTHGVGNRFTPTVIHQCQARAVDEDGTYHRCGYVKEHGDT